MQAVISFFKKIEHIEVAEKIIKQCAIIFVVAGVLEIIMSVVIPQIFYPAVITLVLGGLLYFINTRAVGMVFCLWSLEPFISALSLKVSFSEFFYIIFTAFLAMIGVRGFLATLKLYKLLFPEEEKV